MVKSLEVLTTFWYLKCRAIAEEGANVQQVKDRIIDAHRREIADEKRISDAVVQSLRDKKLEMAGEIAAKEAEIAKLRECMKEAIRDGSRDSWRDWVFCRLNSLLTSALHKENINEKV